MAAIGERACRTGRLEPPTASSSATTASVIGPLSSRRHLRVSGCAPGWAARDGQVPEAVRGGGESAGNLRPARFGGLREKAITSGCSSARSAMTGSIRAARRAGIHAAKAPTSITPTAAHTSTRGSVAFSVLQTALDSSSKMPSVTSRRNACALTCTLAATALGPWPTAHAERDTAQTTAT